MFWQNRTVIDLFMYTFEHYRFHHKLINVIMGACSVKDIKSMNYCLNETFRG